MKSLLTSLGCSISLLCLFLVACQPSHQQDQISAGPDGAIIWDSVFFADTTIANKMSLDTALVHVRAYARRVRDVKRALNYDSIAYTLPVHPHGYLIPIADIVGTDKDHGYCRAYHAYGETAESDGPVVHLVIAPTANLGGSAKEDLSDVFPKDHEGNKYVYDLIAPCPKTCDLMSPLDSAARLLN